MIYSLLGFYLNWRAYNVFTEGHPRRWEVTLNRIFYLQKRAVRAITNSVYRAHYAPLSAKLGIIDIFQINSFQISKFMFYYHNQLLSSMFLNLFETKQPSTQLRY